MKMRVAFFSYSDAKREEQIRENESSRERLEKGCRYLRMVGEWDVDRRIVVALRDR